MDKNAWLPVKLEFISGKYTHWLLSCGFNEGYSMSSLSNPQ